MTTTERKAEADAASIAFHLALTQIGVETLADALVFWDEVPPSARPGTAAAWLNAATRLVLTRRGRSRDLARAYYRLARALRTGRTIPNPRDPEPTFVTLDTLRREFAALAPSNAQEGPSDTAPPSPTDEPASGPEEPLSEDEEADRILIEELAGLEEEDRRLEVEAEEEIRLALEALGPRNQQKLVDDLDGSAPADEVDALREEAHRRAGARQAAAAERVALDGARGTLWSYSRRDPRCIGYVRISRTGTPCGWCAMLISRGPVYRSEGSATYSGGAATYDDGDRYHDNCRCYAEPVFSREQYDESSLFSLNRTYSKQWPEVTSGLSGRAAVSAWRRFIRTEQAAVRAQAAQIPNAQEAAA